MQVLLLGLTFLCPTYTLCGHQYREKFSGAAKDGLNHIGVADWSSPLASESCDQPRGQMLKDSRKDQHAFFNENYDLRAFHDRQF